MSQVEIFFDENWKEKSLQQVKFNENWKEKSIQQFKFNENWKEKSIQHVKFNQIASKKYLCYLFIQVFKKGSLIQYSTTTNISSQSTQNLGHCSDYPNDLTRSV